MTRAISPIPEGYSFHLRRAKRRQPLPERQDEPEPEPGNRAETADTEDDRPAPDAPGRGRKFDISV